MGQDARDGRLEETAAGRCLHVAIRPGPAGSDTVLFLHGGGGSKRQWRLQWQALLPRPVTLLAWDMVGHGSSPHLRNPTGYAGAALLADARTLFDRHATGRTLIVAHSFGARIALALALSLAREQPQAVSGIVLVGPAPIGRINTGTLFGGGLLGRLPLPVLEGLRPLLAARFRRRAWHPDADAALVRSEQRAARGNRLSMMQAMLSDPPAVALDALPGLSVPTIVLAGDSDGIVPADAVAGLAALLPGAELRIISRCGHQIMLERPDETLAAIDALLDRNGEPRR